MNWISRILLSIWPQWLRHTISHEPNFLHVNFQKIRLASAKMPQSSSLIPDFTLYLTIVQKFFRVPKKPQRSRKFYWQLQHKHMFVLAWKKKRKKKLRLGKIIIIHIAFLHNRCFQISYFYYTENLIYFPLHK